MKPPSAQGAPNEAHLRRGPYGGVHMTFEKGHKLPPEAIEKMRMAKLGKKVGPHSEERKAKIAASNKGKVRLVKYERQCACGAAFSSAAINAKFCSTTCGRASRGHGLRHAPEFAHYAKHCAICTSTEQLVGDHCHDSGKPRGILCRNCNLALGNMADDPERLRAAAAYLERASL